MCGIAGYVRRTGSADRGLIEKQLQLLEHRGPDASGSFTGTRAVIGQTRLSIIDLDTGDPPISNASGTIGVALNGEIYNFTELRRSLEQAGHTFRTSGDTEVLAHLSEDLGPLELANSLRGMFAFAIWDEGEQSLLLGRDRVGKKPLYYWHDQTSFVFASEIKALLAHPDVPRDLDTEVIGAYLTFGYVPTPRTFFAGINSLPPGHVLMLGSDGVPTIQPYWEPPLQSFRLERPARERAETFRSALSDAVEARLVADVPVGAFLSGGLDSSAVVAVASGLVAGPLKTFTIGFEESAFDERTYAREVADLFATDHTEFVVKPKAVELVERLVWHHDQPFGDSSAIPTFLLSELTSQEVKVALSGDGGDELLAGYERFAAARAIGSRAGGVAKAAAMIADPLPDQIARGRIGSLKRFAKHASMGLPDALRAWISYTDEATVRTLDPEGSRWALDDYRRIWDASAGASTLRRILDVNMRTYLLDDLLVKLDRMSIAHGLEVRSPFLDHELIETVASFPDGDLLKGMDSKRILKRAFAGVLPQRILERPKRGFGVPMARWFRSDLRSYLSSALGPRARVRGHLQGEGIDRLLSEHDSGKRDHAYPLWTLLTLEVFLQREGW